jgi:hypothetical protein
MFAFFYPNTYSKQEPHPARWSGGVLCILCVVGGETGLTPYNITLLLDQHDLLNGTEARCLHTDDVNAG